MKYIAKIMIFTAGIICGCLLVIVGNIKVSKSEYVIGGKKIIDQIIEEELRKINVDDIIKARPDDVYVENSKIGINNESRFKRVVAASNSILSKIKATFPRITTIELFDSFMSSGYNINEVMYYVARDGNELIADELISRDDALVRLIKNWNRDIFNGGNGGIMINPIVDMLNKKNN